MRGTTVEPPCILTLGPPSLPSRDTPGQSGAGVADVYSFGVLNDSEDILVMVDEAHRSHTNTARARLMVSMPNAVRIGLTGTPIIMGDRKETESIFGGFLDRYTLRESEADGSTVPIFYEGKTTEATVKVRRRWTTCSCSGFRASPTNTSRRCRRTTQTNYATAAQVLEAPKMIRANAETRHRL